MSLDYYKSIVTSVLDKRGYFYNSQDVVPEDDVPFCQYTIEFSGEVTDSDTVCSVYVLENGTCIILVHFVELECPEDKKAILSRKLMDYNMYYRHTYYRLDTDDGAVGKVCSLLFSNDSSWNSWYFTQMFDMVLLFDAEEFEEIKAICMSADGDGNAYSGIKLKL